MLKKLARQEKAIGFLLPAVEKDQLFPSVMTDGTLPRKHFPWVMHVKKDIILKEENTVEIKNPCRFSLRDFCF